MRGTLCESASNTGGVAPSCESRGRERGREYARLRHRRVGTRDESIRSRANETLLARAAADRCHTCRVTLHSAQGAWLRGSATVIYPTPPPHGSCRGSLILHLDGSAAGCTELEDGYDCAG